MSRTSRAGLTRFIEWGVFAGLVVAGVLIWNNRSALADDFRLWNYTPPAAVAALEDKIEFTDQGKRYFYASHPAIEGRSTFNASCGNTEAHGTVLGCYTRDTIYVYDVTDPRLNGVQEVTAAHETLHAAYARLSDSRRASVDAMLQRQYDAMSSSQSFSERFAVYDSLSQADKLNELHSIFGTEVTPLSAELETYYKTYFQDRSVITGYYKAYQGQFSSLKDQQASLKAKIDTLKSDIDSSETAYESDRGALNGDIQTFNATANNGGYRSQAEFQDARARLIARSNALNGEAEAINAKIDQYNDAIARYNALGVQTQDLQNSLDSQSVQSAPSV